MSFRNLLAGMAEAIDDHLGDAALWSTDEGDRPVCVHIIEQDDVARFGEGDIVMKTQVVQIHRRWGITPAAYATVTLQETGETFTTQGDPALDAEGFWTIAVQPA